MKASRFLVHAVQVSWAFIRSRRGVVLEDGGSDDGPVQWALLDDGFLFLVAVNRLRSRVRNSSRELHGICCQLYLLAQRLIAISFAALALYVGFESVRDLVLADRPEESLVGIVLAALSLATMPVLARAKRRLAPLIGSRAVDAEATQTVLCALMSAGLLIGLGANAVLGWWWADPLAGLFIASLAAYETVAVWRAESLADTCCG